MDLDSTLTDLGKLWVIAKPHWPWIMYVAIFAFIGEVSKRRVYAPGNMERMQKEADRLWNMGKSGKFFALFPLALLRVPFEYHPMIAGLIVGLIPGMPMEKGVHYGTYSALYVMSAGIVSLSFYKLLERFWEFAWTNILRKEGPAPELILPGERDSDSPEMPADDHGEDPK